MKQMLTFLQMQIQQMGFVVKKILPPPKKKNLGDLQMFPTPRSHSQVFQSL